VHCHRYLPMGTRGQLYFRQSIQNFLPVQWVDSEKWQFTDPRHKFEVMRLGQVVNNRSQKMNMKKLKQKMKFENL
jgi:hypothetical protein